MSHLIQDWRPEDPQFWQTTGKKTAKRNLWISIPALFLAFAMWQVWSVATLNLPNIGFQFTKNQLFWLAAVPALSGSTLRAVYSFMVPIFGAGEEEADVGHTGRKNYRRRSRTAEPE